MHPGWALLVPQTAKGGFLLAREQVFVAARPSGCLAAEPQNASQLADPACASGTGLLKSPQHVSASY